MSDVVGQRLKPLLHDIAWELPRLRDLTARLLQRNGERYHTIGKRTLLLLEHLRHDLEQRHVDESLELFPLVDLLEHGEGPGDAGDRLARLRWQLELEEAVTLETFEELRDLTRGYRVPQGACPTVRELYRGLRQLERLVRAELRLENKVLFPRALTMAGLAPEPARAN
jgi:regulator of cell morphogenesis and NO signaling